MHQAKRHFKELNGFSDKDMEQFDSIFDPFSSKEEVGLKYALIRPEKATMMALFLLAEDRVMERVSTDTD
jgi:hypothetical protein